MLKVEPIIKYKSPGYPDKRITLENPDILKTLPKRWKGKAFVGLTYSTVAIFILSGCQAPPTTGGTPMEPVYLTEEEAYNVILEESEKYGVSFDKSGLELKDVEIKLDKQSTEGPSYFMHKHNIQLDGFDKEKKIGYEYVSENDIDELYNSTKQLEAEGVIIPWIDSYSTKLEEAIKDQHKELYFDSFYSRGSGTPEEKEKELREQVKGFMEWLKAQGVI